MTIMKNAILIMTGIFFGLFLLSSCGDDDELSTQTLNLNFTGLEDLGPDAIYEGWLIVEGTPVTTGTFSVNAGGTMSQSSFEIAQESIENATTFVLTIEPTPDTDPAPSEVHILAGDFSGDSADLTIDHDAALAQSLTDAAGAYILATPTDDLDINEDSGIWFLDNSSGSPAAGLTLPVLPAGWIYEGWAVIDGNPISTGTFDTAEGTDSAAIYSGNNSGPPFPGEDFLENAPNGLTFPTSLLGGTAVISIEPVPDNSTAPFTLKPLVGAIPAGADVHSVLQMDQNLNFPSGTASR